MKDNTQTRYGLITNFSPPGVPTSSFVVESGKTVFTCYNGEGRGNFSAPTPYGFRKRKVSYAPTNSFYRKDGTYDALEQIGPWSVGLSDPFGWTPTSSFPELLEVALGRLMEDVRGGNQVVVDLAESASTLNMVRAQNNMGNRVSEVFDILAGEVKRKRRLFERLDRRDRTQKLLDYANSRWLELRYGVMPVIYSVYDAMDILYKENLSAVRTLVATAKRPVNGKRDFEEVNFFGGTIPGSHYHNGIERCRLVIEMYTPGSGIWDWTSLNPSVIAWELLPMSFVADWFVSVGDSLAYLENWLLFKNQFRGGYITYSGRGDEYMEHRGSSSNGYYTIRRNMTGEGSSSFKNRVILTEMPLPFAPRIRVNLNASRLLDAVTLSASTWKRQIRGFGRQF